MKRPLLVLVSLISLNAFAQEIHFFGSMDYAKTSISNKTEYAGIKTRPTLSFLNTAGINASTKINDKSSALAQIIHHNEDNKISLDLVQFQRSLPYGFRARLGLQRLPLLLKSEVIQIKALYPWTTIPVEVYAQMPIRSFTGASLERDFGDFSFQLYGGDARDEFVAGENHSVVEAKDLYGVRLNYRHGGWEAYATALTFDAIINTSTPVTIAPSVQGTAKVALDLNSVEMYSAGYSWKNTRWITMSEFLRIKTASPVVKHSSSGYASVGYYLSENSLLLGTFSSEFNRQAEGNPSKTSTYSMNYQYNLDTSTVLKVGLGHVNFRREEEASSISPGTRSDAATGIAGTPSGNFNVYDVQLAFVF